MTSPEAESFAFFASLAFVDLRNLDDRWMCVSSSESICNRLHGAVPHVLVELTDLHLDMLALLQRHVLEESANLLLVVRKNFNEGWIRKDVTQDC